MGEFKSLFVLFFIYLQDFIYYFINSTDPQLGASHSVSGTDKVSTVAERDNEGRNCRGREGSSDMPLKTCTVKR